MPKGVQYDDANSYVAMLVFLGLALVPSTLYFVRHTLCSNSSSGLWTPVSEPGQPMRPGSLRSVAARRRRNAVQVIKVVSLLALWALFVWLAAQVAATVNSVYDPFEILGLDPGASTREIKRR